MNQVNNFKQLGTPKHVYQLNTSNIKHLTIWPIQAWKILN